MELGVVKLDQSLVYKICGNMDDFMEEFSDDEDFFVPDDVIATARDVQSELPIGCNDRLFLSYRNGKCTVQPIGIHTVAKMPRMIAEFLNIKDPELYTGHCFRRTAASLLVEGGGDLLTLKRFGGWKSSAVAEGYVEESIAMKMDITKRVMESSKKGEDVQASSHEDVSNLPSTSASFPSVPSGITFGNLTNCSFTFNFGSNQKE